MPWHHVLFLGTRHHLGFLCSCIKLCVFGQNCGYRLELLYLGKCILLYWQPRICCVLKHVSNPCYSSNIVDFVMCCIITPFNFCLLDFWRQFCPRTYQLSCTSNEARNVCKLFYMIHTYNIAYIMMFLLFQR